MYITIIYDQGKVPENIKGRGFTYQLGSSGNLLAP